MMRSSELRIEGPGSKAGEQISPNQMTQDERSTVATKLRDENPVLYDKVIDALKRSHDAAGTGKTFEQETMTTDELAIMRNSLDTAKEAYEEALSGFGEHPGIDGETADIAAQLAGQIEALRLLKAMSSDEEFQQALVHMGVKDEHLDKDSRELAKVLTAEQHHEVMQKLKEKSPQTDEFITEEYEEADIDYGMRAAEISHIREHTTGPEFTEALSAAGVGDENLSATDEELAKLFKKETEYQEFVKKLKKTTGYEEPLGTVGRSINSYAEAAVEASDSGQGEYPEYSPPHVELEEEEVTENYELLKRMLRYPSEDSNRQWVNDKHHPIVFDEILTGHETVTGDQFTVLKRDWFTHIQDIDGEKDKFSQACEQVEINTGITATGDGETKNVNGDDVTPKLLENLLDKLGEKPFKVPKRESIFSPEPIEHSEEVEEGEITDVAYYRVLNEEDLKHFLNLEKVGIEGSESDDAIQKKLSAPQQEELDRRIRGKELNIMENLQKIAWTEVFKYRDESLDKMGATDVTQ